MRSHNPRNSAVLSMMLVLVIVAGACGAPAPAVGGPLRDRASLIMAVQKAAPSLDPTIDTVNYYETDQIFDWLIATDANMKLVPGLATEWKQTDALNWQFKLRQGVKFQNGDPFTCADVKFTLDRIMNPDTKSRQLATYFSDVATVRCVDDFTLQVATKLPNPVFLGRFSFLRVVPAKAFQQLGEAQFALKPIGSGPYRLVDWTQNSKATLEAFDGYWAGSPSIKHLEIRTVTEPSTRLAMLRSGQVDWIYDVPPCDAADVAKDPNLEVSSTRSMNAMFVGINSFQKPMDDVRVRRALNYAVNWDEIIKSVLCGYGYRNAASTGSYVLGYDTALKPYSYDPVKAKQLLSEAGVGSSFNIAFEGPVGRYKQDKEVGQAVAGYLKDVGVTSDLRQTDFTTFFSRVLAKNIAGVFLLGCVSVGGGDFDLCNRLWFHSKVRGFYYSTPQVDALLDAEASTLDPVQRLTKLQALMGVIQSEAPWIFGYDEAVIVANRKGLAQELRPDLSALVFPMRWK